MKRCVFLSTDRLEGFVTDDELAVGPLATYGWEVVSIPWKTTVDWSQFDAVVVRSTWDYQDHLNEFVEVLERINNSQTPLANPIELMRWNVNKRYLFDLQSRGIEIAPTLIASGSDLETCFDQLDSEEIVIKPIVGANADFTYRVSSSSGGVWAELEQVFAERSALVQPFLRSVVDEGEYSLIYLGGELSHTILKTPTAGDFRVQEEHGGSISAVTPDGALVETGRRILELIQPKPLYARIDLAKDEASRFVLMELELVEPSLYLRMDKKAPNRFASAFLNWINPR